MGNLLNVDDWRYMAVGRWLRYILGWGSLSVGSLLGLVMRGSTLG